MEDEPVLPLSVAVDSSGEAHSLLVFGSSAIQLMKKEGRRLDLKIESRYLTDLPKVEHAAVDWGDFNHDGKPDLLCIDGRRRFPNSLPLMKKQAMEKRSSFKVFEENLYYQGRKDRLSTPGGSFTISTAMAG